MPIWIAFALLSPTLLVAFLVGMHQVGGPKLGDPATLLLLWLFGTVPVALFAIGVRGMRLGSGAEQDVQSAMAALARADQVAMQSGQALQRVEAFLAAKAAERKAASAGAAMPIAVSTGGRRGFIALASLVFLVGAGGLGAVFAYASIEDPIHEHAAFAVYVDGERISFESDAFDFGTTGFMRGHVHVQNRADTPYHDGQIIHIEGEPGLTLREFFEKSLKSELGIRSLKLDDAVHGGRLLQEKDGATLQLWVAAPDADGTTGDGWRLVDDPPDYVPRDQERLLLTFGKNSPGELATMWQSVPGAEPDARFLG